VGEIYSTNGRGEIKLKSENWKGRDHLKGLGVHERIILKWILDE
jgi:hypothetical protein